MNKVCMFALSLALALCAGCEKPNEVSSARAANLDPGIPTQAQPKLQAMKLWLGAEELNTELALTADQQRAGMMFRTNMLESEAMLFVFPYPHRAAFWMMNTVLPLSAAYIDPEGVILEIHDFQPRNTNSVVASSENVQYVLETKQGWFKRHSVGTGTVIRTERGTLRETFFRKQ